eukprot:scaffold160349_cov99-Cyclotella_meneghiniana.AAC.1
MNAFGLPVVHSFQIRDIAICSTSSTSKYPQKCTQYSSCTHLYVNAGTDPAVSGFLVQSIPVGCTVYHTYGARCKLV